MKIIKRQLLTGQVGKGRGEAAGYKLTGQKILRSSANIVGWVAWR